MDPFSEIDVTLASPPGQEGMLAESRTLIHQTMRMFDGLVAE